MPTCSASERQCVWLSVTLLQTLVPFGGLLAAQPDAGLQHRMRAFAERVCGHGWAAAVPGGGSRTVLVPHRYSIVDEGSGAPVRRATLVAAVGDGTSAVLVDTSLTGVLEAVNVDLVRWTLPAPPEAAALKDKKDKKDKADAQTLQWRWAVPVTAAVQHFVAHGSLLDVPGHGLASFPPRRVEVNVGGEPMDGWVVGWSIDTPSVLVATGRYADPGIGCAASLSADLASGAVIAVAETAVSPPAALTAVQAFLLDAAKCNGSGSYGHVVVDCSGVKLPAPQCTQLPGARFEHLRCHRGSAKPAKWPYALLVAGDVGPLFANNVIIRHMDVTAPAAWDISAAIPCLQACKGLRRLSLLGKRCEVLGCSLALPLGRPCIDCLRCGGCGFVRQVRSACRIWTVAVPSRM